MTLSRTLAATAAAIANNKAADLRSRAAEVAQTIYPEFAASTVADVAALPADERFDYVTIDLESEFASLVASLFAEDERDDVAELLDREDDTLQFFTDDYTALM